MFVLVILNKGFKSKCHFNRFILFCFSSSDQFFSSRVETFVNFWKGGYLGTFVRKIYILDSKGNAHFQYLFNTSKPYQILP